ncbi:MAG: ATP-dependent Clp protease adapter protein ClpS [Pseudomonadota bacterium]|jgi:ATP-dependent Clp protease adaptor protein ClpS
MASTNHDPDIDTVLERVEQKVKPPPMHKVMILNDDYTPMDFVVRVLQGVFQMSREKATTVMLAIHRNGMGVCGVYTKDIATTKVEIVLALAQEQQHPLQCLSEEE